MKLTDREVANVLAALRRWQSELDWHSSQYTEQREHAKGIMPDHFSQHRPMATNELDKLCEKINTKE